ncbi:hypothetical protein P3T73_01135 [Kiritimatiellota bacterium B12222]|nr:hypothetical protein P3T73_01135 [Kiritimatiellota bacterium B12222]
MTSPEDYEFHASVLATFIPSKQLAVGGEKDPLGFSDSSGDSQRVFEMQHEFDNEGWYKMSDYKSDEYWYHGDFKKVAMPYVWKLYERFITRGGLR